MGLPNEEQWLYVLLQQLSKRNVLVSTQLIMMYKYPQKTCVKVYIMCKFMHKRQDVPNKASTKTPS